MLVALISLGYVSAAVLFVAQLYNLKQTRRAMAAGWIGFGAESLWLVWIAIRTRAFPATTMETWVAFFIWLAVGLYLLFSQRFRLRPVGAFLFPVTALVWLASQLVLAPSHPRAASGWLVVHIVSAALSDAAFLLACVFGIMYIEKERELQSKRVRLFYYQLPPLEDMDVWLGRFLVAGWLLFTLTLISGALWAFTSHTGLVMGLATEVWALATWVVYGFLLVARIGLHWRGHRLAVSSMVAFLVVLGNVFGVSLLFPGPHHAGF
nr:cytochrome c biogenesis protein CcsA [Sulfobacillus harzensis]